MARKQRVTGYPNKRLYRFKGDSGPWLTTARWEAMRSYFLHAGKCTCKGKCKYEIKHGIDVIRFYEQLRRIYKKRGQSGQSRRVTP